MDKPQVKRVTVPFIPQRGAVLKVENLPPWFCPKCGTANAFEDSVCRKEGCGEEKIVIEVLEL